VVTHGTEDPVASGSDAASDNYFEIYINFLTNFLQSL
jgi:hypothetical protein